MFFDFDTFTKLATKVYSGGPYTLDQVLRVFKYYFSCYENAMGHPHPNIRMEQIRHIIQVMPYIDRNDVGAYMADIEPEAYEYLIDQHFKTRYRNCDYNINHFFSGRIRELRFYERCY